MNLIGLLVIIMNGKKIIDEPDELGLYHNKCHKDLPNYCSAKTVKVRKMPENKATKEDLKNEIVDLAIALIRAYDEECRSSDHFDDILVKRSKNFNLRVSNKSTGSTPIFKTSFTQTSDPSKKLTRAGLYSVAIALSNSS